MSASQVPPAPAPSAPIWGLLLSLNPSVHPNVELSKAETSFGRTPECDVRFEAPTVSTLHCRITQDKEASGEARTSCAIFIEDQSINGTFVNSVNVGKGNRVKLNSGDQISLPTPSAIESDKCAYIFQDIRGVERKETEAGGPQSAAVSQPSASAPVAAVAPVAKQQAAPGVSLEALNALNGVQLVRTLPPMRPYAPPPRMNRAPNLASAPPSSASGARSPGAPAPNFAAAQASSFGFGARASAAPPAAQPARFSFGPPSPAPAPATPPAAKAVPFAFSPPSASPAPSFAASLPAPNAPFVFSPAPAPAPKSPAASAPAPAPVQAAPSPANSPFEFGNAAAAARNNSAAASNAAPSPAPRAAEQEEPLRLVAIREAGLSVFWRSNARAEPSPNAPAAQGASHVFCLLDGYTYARAQLVEWLRTHIAPQALFSKATFPSGVAGECYVREGAPVEEQIASVLRHCVDDWTASSGQTECALTLQPFEAPFFYPVNGRAYSCAALQQAVRQALLKGDPLNLDIGVTISPENPNTMFVEYRGVWTQWGDAPGQESNPQVRVLRFDPERALLPLCQQELAVRHNVPEFSVWLHNVPQAGNPIWDALHLYRQWARARGLSGRDLNPPDSVLVVRDLVVSGARLFAHHPKMDVGKFIFRNVVFNRCLFIEDCFCGVSFYSCHFVNCIFKIPGWDRSVERACLRRCTYLNGVLWVTAGDEGAARRGFVRAVRAAGGEGQGHVSMVRTLAQAINRLPPGEPLLFSASTPASCHD